MLLSVKDLRTYFFTDEGTVKAVDGVDFEIEKGTTLGVVGESGCGKSVTARSIMRLLPKTGRIVSGEILFNLNGQTVDIAKLPKEEMRKIRGRHIAMIFQEPMAAFSPVHTVGDQITEAMMFHFGISKEEAMQKAIETLRRVGIPKPEQMINAYPFEYSGGMRQRAMIAMAISCNPDLLIADEPTTALDVTIQAQVLELLRELQRDYNMAIMMITHNMGVIAEMADHVVVMYLGKILESAPVEELFYNPKHPYTMLLLRSIPVVGKRVERLEVIKGDVPDPRNMPKGCRFHPRCPYLMRDLCDQKEPPTVEVSKDHKVSCFLYGGERDGAS